MSDIKFSIIIPIYNVEKYLKQCLDSVCGQTYKNFEVILVDDGSIDESPRICDEYAEKDGRVKVIHQQNSGVNKARKVATQAAIGEYIVPVDADDWISTDLLMKAHDALEKYNADIFCYDSYIAVDDNYQERHTWFEAGYYDKEKLNSSVYPNLLRNIYGRRFSPGVWGKVFKSELYKKFQLNANDIIRIGEDESVSLPSVFSADSIYVSSECLYYYRQIPTSATKAKRGFPWTDIPARAEIYRKYLPMDKFDFKAQLDRLIVHELFTYAVSYLRTDMPYKQAKKMILNYFNDDFYKDAIKNCRYKKNIKEQLATFAVRHKVIVIIAIYAKFFR